MSATAVIRDESRQAPAALLRGRVEALLFAAVTLGVLLLGAVEDWFGADSSGDLYGSDAVQYLDVARAIGRGDWHTAFSPLWSLGYPALVAGARGLFQAGPWGDWLATRTVNLIIFALCWAGFCLLVRELLRTPLAAKLTGSARGLALGGAALIFLTTQLTVGQASRTGPDELVAAIFFLAAAVLLRPPTVARGVYLGVLLGAGFLVKAAFLLVGAALLLGWAWWLASPKRGGLSRRGVLSPLAAVLVFMAIVFSYGARLSQAVGHWTLGESGAINYAWHVDRLAKWVHWEGGTDPAVKAWPKPALARFAQWDASPPDFGRPLHPSVMVGTNPTVYVFHAPVTATYVPYFDPPYWYEGYKHVFRWRYQAIALVKSASDMGEVLSTQPLFYAWLAVMVLVARRRETRIRARRRLRSVWPLGFVAWVGIITFLPVHLEGRYFSGELAVLGAVVLLAVFAARERPLARWETALCAVLLVSATVAGLFRARLDVIARMHYGWAPQKEAAWVTGEDVAALLPAGAEVGMISWQPNLQSDWAYVAGVRITSEIADGEDERAFWALPAEGKARVLQSFRDAGARAVTTWDKPQGDASGWRQLPASAMWIYVL